MKNIFLLLSCITVLLSLTVFSCKTKKSSTEVTTTTVPAPPVTASAPVYTADIKNILDKNCVGCHRSPLPPPGPDFPHRDPGLDSYEAVKKAAANTSFLGVINHEQGFPPMPAGGTKLDDATILRITTWVQSGMPE